MKSKSVVFDVCAGYGIVLAGEWVIDEWLIGKDLEGSELDIIEILFQDFDGGIP
jgi:hypothetical protein